MNVNKTHHQNSGLAAQPSNCAYLLKQTLIASPNVIDPLAAIVVHSLGYACRNTSTQVLCSNTTRDAAGTRHPSSRGARRAPRVASGHQKSLKERIFRKYLSRASLGLVGTSGSLRNPPGLEMVSALRSSSGKAPIAARSPTAD